MRGERGCHHRTQPDLGREAWRAGVVAEPRGLLRSTGEAPHSHLPVALQTGRKFFTLPDSTVLLQHPLLAKPVSKGEMGTGSRAPESQHGAKKGSFGS